MVWLEKWFWVPQLVLAGVLTFSVALNFGVLQSLVFPSFVSLEEEAAEQNLNRVTCAKAPIKTGMR